MQISCRFQDCKGLLGSSLTCRRSTIASFTLRLHYCTMMQCPDGRTDGQDKKASCNSEIADCTYFITGTASNENLLLMPVSFDAWLPYHHYTAKLLGAQGQRRGLKVVKSSFLGAFSIHLFGQFCRRMYRLYTVYSITDRRSDRQTYRRQYHANIPVCSTSAKMDIVATIW